MKKTMKLLVAAAMLLTATSANAQFSKKENNRVPDRFHMGLRAGLTASTLMGDNTEDIKALLFPYGGLAFDFQVAPVPIFVGIGLNYMNMGYKYDLVYYDWNSYRYEESETQDAHCLQIPITASYHINVAPNLFVNPFFGPWFAYNFTDIDKDDDWQNERFDYGLRFGCGVNYGRLYFDMGYDLGLKNLYDGKHDYSINTGVFFMTLGFNWAGNR